MHTLAAYPSFESYTYIPHLVPWTEQNSSYEYDFMSSISTLF